MPDPFDPFSRPDPYASFISETDSQIEALKPRISKLQEQAFKQDDFSLADGLSTAFLGLLPGLVGYAAGGYSGGAIGGAVGASAAGSYAENLAKENEKERTRAGLQLKTAQEELDTLNKNRRDYQIKGAEANVRRDEIGYRDELSDENAAEKFGRDKQLQAIQHGYRVAEKGIQSADSIATHAKDGTPLTPFALEVITNGSIPNRQLTPEEQAQVTPELIKMAKDQAYAAAQTQFSKTSAEKLERQGLEKNIGDLSLPDGTTLRFKLKKDQFPQNSLVKQTEDRIAANQRGIEAMEQLKSVLKTGNASNLGATSEEVKISLDRIFRALNAVDGGGKALTQTEIDKLFQGIPELMGDNSASAWASLKATFQGRDPVRQLEAYQRTLLNETKLQASRHYDIEEISPSSQSVGLRPKSEFASKEEYKAYLRSVKEGQ